MAADILLYQTNIVPVGVDQSQHIEICRDIANRFNGVFPDTFTIPEGRYPKAGEGAKIMSLSDPEKKMSKSDENENGYILLMDQPDVIMRKFKRAVTDSDARIVMDPQGKPGISNLLQIYALATGKTVAEAEAEFAGKGYGEFKPAVGEVVVELLRPIREKTLSARPRYIPAAGNPCCAADPPSFRGLGAAARRGGRAVVFLYAAGQKVRAQGRRDRRSQG